MNRILTNSFIGVLNCNMLKNIAPIWSGKMSLDLCLRDYINPALSMIKGLKHSDQSRTSISFFVNTCAVVVELNHTVFVVLRHLIHHTSKPLERALLTSDPIEVGSFGGERLSLEVVPGAILYHLILYFLVLLDVVKHIFQNANQRSGADSKAYQEDYFVLFVILCWCTIWSVD